MLPVNVSVPLESARIVRPGNAGIGLSLINGVLGAILFAISSDDVGSRVWQGLIVGSRDTGQDDDHDPLDDLESRSGRKIQDTVGPPRHDQSDAATRGQTSRDQRGRVRTGHREQGGRDDNRGQNAKRSHEVSLVLSLSSWRRTLLTVLRLLFFLSPPIPRLPKRKIHSRLNFASPLHPNRVQNAKVQDGPLRALTVQSWYHL